MRRYNLQSWKRRNNRIFETNYSRMDQVKFVENSLVSFLPETLRKSVGNDFTYLNKPSWNLSVVKQKKKKKKKKTPPIITKYF